MVTSKRNSDNLAASISPNPFNRGWSQHPMWTVCIYRFLVLIRCHQVVQIFYLLSWHGWCEGGWGVTRPKLVAAADLKKIVVWSWNDDGSDTQVTEDHGVKREQSANHTSLWYSAFDQKHTPQGMVISKPMLLRPKNSAVGCRLTWPKNSYPVGLIPWFEKNPKNH